MLNPIDRIEVLTEEQLQIENESSYTIVADASEELGELCRAMRIEDSVTKRHKTLDEPSTHEAIDLVICAFATYFARGGKKEEIDLLMNKKLDKWVDNVDRNVSDGETK